MKSNTNSINIDKNNTEQTQLHYIKNESTNMPIVNYSGNDESQSYSEEYIFNTTEIINARILSNDRSFSLDKEAFKLVKFTPNEINFLNSDIVKSDYYRHVEALVKKETGASDVFAFDHTVRRGIQHSNRHPAYHIHNDYTYNTGKIRAISVLGKDVITRFLGKRMIQVNVWRSIDGVVEKDPLALMDATTLNQNDLVQTEIRFNDTYTNQKHTGEIFALKKNAAQRWYYYPKMDAEEAILIKGFDTDKSRSCFAMHTAFELSHQNKNTKPRQSIETRTYAFFNN